MINIGFACQIVGVRNYKMKTCRLDGADTERLKKMTRENLQTLMSMLEYCKDNQIHLFRMSSDVIPFGSHPLKQREWWKEEEEMLLTMGKFILENDIRVSMHPGQYTVLNSPKEEVVIRGVDDLLYHTRLIDSMGLPKSHKIILHIGGAYDDKGASLERFITKTAGLHKSILHRLVIENDEKMYNPDDVLYAVNKLGLPAVMDNLHYELNHTGETDFYSCVSAAAHTWKKDDGRQKIHYSQQRVNGHKGAHSNTIDLEKWLEDSEKFHDIDVMLEVKDKNISAIKCDLIQKGCSSGRLQKEWGRYKYLVMRHSQKHYEQLKSGFLRGISPKEFFMVIEEALRIEPTEKTIRNAAQHVWDYFKEKENFKRFQNLLEKYSQQPNGANVIFSYLYRLAEKYDEQYLLDGYSFYID